MKRYALRTKLTQVKGRGCVCQCGFTEKFRRDNVLLAGKVVYCEQENNKILKP